MKRFTASEGTAAKRSLNSAQWAWIVATVAATGAGLVLAFVLSFSGAEGGTYERHFVWLFFFPQVGVSGWGFVTSLRTALNLTSLLLRISR